MKRAALVGLIGLALVIGAILAWQRFSEEVAAPVAAPAPAPASAPGTGPAAPPAERPAASVPVAPVAPAPTAPAFDVVRISPNGDAVIAGRAAPDATVVIQDGEREIGRVKADARGEWVLVPEKVLPAGPRALSLATPLPDGGALRSERVVVLDVPGQAPPAGAEASPPLVVATPRSGPGASTIIQTPAPRPGGPLALEVVDYGEGGRIVFSGRAAPEAIVQLYIDNRLVGRTRADAEGQWSLTPDEDVAPGTYTLRIDQVGPDGRVAARVEVPFARSGPSRELAADETQVVIQPGNSLWRIARRVYGEGTRYTVIYAANQDQIRDPDLIYPGQVFVLPKIN